MMTLLCSKSVKGFSLIQIKAEILQMVHYIIWALLSLPSHLPHLLCSSSTSFKIPYILWAIPYLRVFVLAMYSAWNVSWDVTMTCSISPFRSLLKCHLISRFSLIILLKIVTEEPHSYPHSSPPFQEDSLSFTSIIVLHQVYYYLTYCVFVYRLFSLLRIWTSEGWTFYFGAFPCYSAWHILGIQ